MNFAHPICCSEPYSEGCFRDVAESFREAQKQQYNGGFFTHIAWIRPWYCGCQSLEIVDRT